MWPTCRDVLWVSIDVQGGSVFSMCPSDAQHVPLWQIKFDQTGRPLPAKQPDQEPALLPSKAQLSMLDVRVTVHEGSPWAARLDLNKGEEVTYMRSYTMQAP